MQSNGFYTLYQISFDSSDDNQTSSFDRENSHGGGRSNTGLKSIYGSIGIISKEFGWSWHELMWQIPWVTIQKILADQPRYNLPKKESIEEKTMKFEDYLKTIHKVKKNEQ
ncbi:hypothetical protein J2Y60_004606 [Arcicella sp. BE140]|nr:hypothetical protein [Arcicella sp. BE140]